MYCPYAWCAWSILQSAYKQTEGLDAKGNTWSLVFEILFTDSQTKKKRFILELFRADNTKLDDLRAIARFANDTLSNNQLVPSEPHSQINAWSTFEFAFQDLLSNPSKVHYFDDSMMKYYQSIPILAAVVTSMQIVTSVQRKF
jgi:hypothetical protein